MASVFLYSSVIIYSDNNAASFLLSYFCCGEGIIDRYRKAIDWGKRAGVLEEKQHKQA